MSEQAPNTSRLGRRLAQRRLQIALWIAVVEGVIIAISQDISWWVALVIAVFLSNVPEGLSSADGMKQAGRSAGYVFGVWVGIAVISGPSPLKGGIVESPDIRAGMAMLLAALAAEGSSVIHNVGQIERGYERIDERLRALGADIERRDD